MPLSANYFDGRSTRPNRVLLHADGEDLIISDMAANPLGAIPASQIRVSEPQGRAPRTLRFRDRGDLCEVEQGPELLELLANLKHTDSAVVKAQRSKRWIFGSMLGFVATIVALFFWGLPLAAEWVAPIIPVNTLKPAGDQALSLLDKMMSQSTLPEARKEALTQAFQTLVKADPTLAEVYGKDGIILLFRSWKDTPNAFALPNGNIIVVDELINLFTDDEILAVLAHELGHLKKRHSIRLILQSSIVGIAAAYWLGDVSTALAGGATILLQSKYSRGMETEADDYGAKMMHRLEKSPVLLANALQKLEDYYAVKEKEEKKEKKKKENASGEDSSVIDWISSHPGTRERITRIKNL